MPSQFLETRSPWCWNIHDGPYNLLLILLLFIHSFFPPSLPPSSFLIFFSPFSLVFYDHFYVIILSPSPSHLHIKTVPLYQFLPLSASLLLLVFHWRSSYLSIYLTFPCIMAVTGGSLGSFPYASSPIGSLCFPCILATAYWIPPNMKVDVSVASLLIMSRVGGVRVTKVTGSS